MELTCWTYTKDEWNRFLQWKRREKGVFYALIRKLIPVKEKKAPEVKITTDRVWMNLAHEPFDDGQRQFREAHIREEGSIHILEIRYEQGNIIRGIPVPIPKGKLREAFAIQERLLFRNGSDGQAGSH